MARETELSFPLAFISLFIFIPVNNKQLHLDDLKDFKCDKRTKKKDTMIIVHTNFLDFTQAKRLVA